MNQSPVDHGPDQGREGITERMVPPQSQQPGKAEDPRRPSLYTNRRRTAVELVVGATDPSLRAR